MHQVFIAPDAIPMMQPAVSLRMVLNQRGRGAFWKPGSPFGLACQGTVYTWSPEVHQGSKRYCILPNNISRFRLPGARKQTRRETPGLAIHTPSSRSSTILELIPVPKLLERCKYLDV
jgi:hypothetical protein